MPKVRHEVTMLLLFFFRLRFVGGGLVCESSSLPLSFLLDVSAELSATSSSLTNKLTKKPFVASSPGEHRTTDSASSTRTRQVS